MSDFYRELETSLAGKRPRRMGLLGWLAISFFTLAGLMGVGVWMGVRFVRDKIESVYHQSAESPALVAARMLSRMDPQLQLLSDQGREGVARIRDLRSGEVSAFSLQDPFQGSLRVRTEEGDVSIDVRGDENGGRLVIDTPEGSTTAELSKDEDGGRLVIDTPDGRTTAELQREGEGGTLLIQSPDGTVQLGAGTAARPLPGWLPQEGSMPSDVPQIYSATTEENNLGAVAWQADRRPERILDYYQDRLEDQGFEVTSQSWSQRGERRQGSLWAEDRDGGRTAFVVAAREDGRTEVVLGYGEKR